MAKQFKISELIGRLEQASTENRFDQVTRNVHAVFEKRMAANPQAIVSSEDLRGMYSAFASLNPQSSFREHFPEVFASAEVAPTTHVDRDTTLSDDYRPMASSWQASPVEAVKQASFDRVSRVMSAAVDFPEYSFRGFTKIAKYGDSGFANWAVSFNTGHGSATVNVPVVVVDGLPYPPSKFYARGGEGEFSPEGIRAFSKSFRGDRAEAEQKSGLVGIGQQTKVAHTDTMESADSNENETVSLSFSLPIDGNLEASIDHAQQKLLEAIDAARCAASKRIESSEEKSPLNINMQISYSGALDFNGEEPGAPTDEGAPSPDDPVVFEDMEGVASPASGEAGVPMAPGAEDFDGVVVFNATAKVRGGIRVATIPVRVKGKDAKAEAFYGDGEVHTLDAKTLSEFLSKDIAEEQESEEQVAAFADAFLASASYNELRKEMKENIEGGRKARANACLYAIANRFGAAASQDAMSDYSAWSSDAASGRKTRIEWRPEHDDAYNGVIKSSSICLS